MVDELDGGVFVDDDELDAVDRAVFEIETDVFFVVVCFSVNESTILVVSVTSLPLGIAVIGAAVAKLSGHSSTYVVSAPSEALMLLVGNSSETPPCSSETTRIVTVTTSPFVVLVFVVIEAEDEEEGGEAKMSAVPAAVMLGGVEVDTDAVVELT